VPVRAEGYLADGADVLSESAQKSRFLGVTDVEKAH
jgi:hypothetical protein